MPLAVQAVSPLVQTVLGGCGSSAPAPTDLGQGAQERQQKLKHA